MALSLVVDSPALRRFVTALLMLGAAESAAVAAEAPPLDRPNVRLVANGNVVAMTRLPDGSVVFGGTFQSVNGEARRGIAKMRADGTLDRAFHPDVHYSVGALASDAAGNVYAGGDFLSIDGVARLHLAKLDGASGAVDPDWNPSPDGSIKAIAIDADGDVFVSGSFAQIGGAARNAIAKLSGGGAGAADAAWDPDPAGGAIATAVDALAIFDASLYVAGSFDVIGGRTRRDLAKLSIAGTGEADANWHPVPSTGSSSYDSVSSISVDASGDVYVSGTFNSISGTTRYEIAKLSGGSGAVDGAWDAGVSWPYTVSRVVAGDDGAIYAFGEFIEIGGATRPHLAKLSAATGAADTGWDPEIANSVISEPVRALLAAADGTVFVGGTFFSIGGEYRLSFAVLGSGGAANSVSIDAEMPGSVNAVVEQTDGGAVVAGEFAKADGQSRPHILRLAADGTLDAAWNPGIDYTVNALALDSAGNVYAGGLFANAGGLPRLHITRMTAAGAVDASWNPSAADAPSNLVSVNALAVDAADNLYVGGYFNRFGGQVRGGLAKVDSAGNVDASWDPGVAAEFPNVYALALDGGSLYAGGTFNHAGGEARHNLAKLATTGTGAADAAWNPAPDGWIVYDVIADHSGSLYVNGAFTVIGGQSRNSLARLATAGAGSADAGWDPALTATPGTIAFDGRYVYASLFDFEVGTRILRFGADCAGASDTAWNAVANDAVYVMAPGVGGSVTIGGRFTTADNVARGGLAAFDAAASAGCPVDDTIFADGFDG